MKLRKKHLEIYFCVCIVNLHDCTRHVFLVPGFPLRVFLWSFVGKRPKLHYTCHLNVQHVLLIFSLAGHFVTVTSLTFQSEFWCSNLAQAEHPWRHSKWQVFLSISTKEVVLSVCNVSLRQKLDCAGNLRILSSDIWYGRNWIWGGILVFFKPKHQYWYI